MTATPRQTKLATGRGGLAWLLAALWLLAHIGCHGDEDTELCLTPPPAEQSAAPPVP